MKNAWRYGSDNYEAPVSAHLHGYVKALGFDLAAKLFLELGGAEIAFSRKSQSETSSLLVRAVGQEGVAALNREFSNHETIKRVPIASEFVIRHLYAKGESVAAIARQVRRTDVSVRKALSSVLHRKSS